MARCGVAALILTAVRGRGVVRELVKMLERRIAALEARHGLAEHKGPRRIECWLVEPGTMRSELHSVAEWPDFEMKEPDERMVGVCRQVEGKWRTVEKRRQG